MPKPVDTVEELIEKLMKMPKDWKVQVNVDNAYTSYVYNVHVEAYDKKHGNKYVTLRCERSPMMKKSFYGCCIRRKEPPVGTHPILGAIRKRNLIKAYPWIQWDFSKAKIHFYGMGGDRICWKIPGKYKGAGVLFYHRTPGGGSPRMYVNGKVAGHRFNVHGHRSAGFVHAVKVMRNVRRIALEKTEE